MDSYSPMSLDTCTPHHDWFNAFLTFGLCCGLVISYLPQHYRIIHTKSSEGFSPVFLLLGTTSAASGMFNMITLQAPIVKCCRVVSLGSCIEMSAGVIQVGLQWVCFGFVFVLYMLYYPEHLKYVQIDIEEGDEHRHIPVKTPVRSEEWRLSVILAWITVAHFILLFLTTAYLLLTPTDAAQLSLWATFLGVSSATLAAIQYMPQLMHTYRTKLVGALSIPMMLIQTPGGILMVTSIVLRPGTNWTSWATFAIAAILQGCLLAMCIAWKVRQKKLQIDDFGNPLHPTFPPNSWSDVPSNVHSNVGTYNRSTSPYLDDEDSVPGLVTTPSENPIAVRTALTRALESAAESNLMSPALEEPSREENEQTPLLKRTDSSSVRSSSTSRKAAEAARGWQAWFGR
ncbi:hypothetical protein CPC08DRAFT_208796 [Agrocybe pediades]|nr:hypothetical protein CPC08DRAFT_208796 [Agrocybe pediades]